MSREIFKGPLFFSIARELDVAIKDFSFKVLKKAEDFYLLAHGWRRDEAGWNSPEWYPKYHRGVTASRAVNSQRFHKETL